MKTISNEELGGLLARGAVEINPRETEEALRAILLELVRNLSSIEDGMSAVEDTICNKLDEGVTMLRGVEEPTFEFTIERDEAGFIKKVIARKT